MIFFYDTCSLINSQDEIFENKNKFYISSISLNELERIKTSGTKDEDIKYRARLLLHKLSENEDRYKIIIFKNEYLNRISEYDLPDTDDTKIIATAYCCIQDSGGEGFFVTDDLACRAVAKSIGLRTNFVLKKEDKYTGFKETYNTDEELTKFYNSYLPDNKNVFDLLENQYLILRDTKGKIVDKYRWYDKTYHQVQYQKIESRMFGKIGPKNGDSYQQLAIDSLFNNQITVLRGGAGTGKSLLGLAYLFQELERGRIDKIIMFVNPVATKDSCKFGFLPGSAFEKILGSQIGHFLASKLGDMSMVEKLVYDGALQLIPIADCRGFDTTGMNAGLYITEAQNTTKEMMKLLLQRVGEDTICVIEGDDDTQVDMVTYSGKNNGLKRLSEVFRGEPYYGEVNLQNCYRSAIADKAEEF